MKYRQKYKLKNISGFKPTRFEGMIVKSLINEREAKKLVAYHIRIPKNTRIPHSYHKVAHEIILIISGKGNVHLDEEVFPVKPKDTILVQPYTWHSFSTGRAPLEILAVLTPRVNSKTDLYHE